MKAAVTHGMNDVRIDEVETPLPQKDEVIVKVLIAGICGGDIRIFKGTFPYLNYPIINGHEFCGIINNVGEDVKGISKGDYVTAEPILPCNNCYACSIGKPNCCANLKVLGVHVNGCFAEYIAVRADRIFKLPGTLSPEKASMVEPYSIAMHALNRLQLNGRDNLLILGAGPIGLAVLDIAKSMGCRVMISDVFEKRLAIAKKLNADALVNPQLNNINECVREFTNNSGFSAVLEATGVPTVMQSTQDYVANGGRICIAGVTDHTVEFSSLTFCRKEATIIGTRNSYNEFPQVIKMFTEDKLHPNLLCTHEFDLDHYSDAIEMASESSSNVCKILMRVAAK